MSGLPQGYCLYKSFTAGRTSSHGRPQSFRDITSIPPPTRPWPPSFSIPPHGWFGSHSSLRGGTLVYNEHSRDWLASPGIRPAQKSDTVHSLDASDTSMREGVTRGRGQVTSDHAKRHQGGRKGYGYNVAHGQKPDNHSSQLTAHNTQHGDAASRALALCARPP